MKAFLFGPSGVGKTTIGKVLSEEIYIPFFELDKIFWDSDKSNSITDEGKRNEIVDNLLINNKNWLIEGMYRQDWLNKIIIQSDYIFIIKRNKVLVDIQLIYRTIKRMLGFEKSERESSLNIIIDFIKFNHSGRFESIHLKEFNQRLSILNKKAIYVSSLKQIKKGIGENKK